MCPYVFVSALGSYEMGRHKSSSSFQELCETEGPWPRESELTERRAHNGHLDFQFHTAPEL